MTAVARVGTVRPVLDVDGFLNRWRRLPPPWPTCCSRPSSALVTVVSVVVEDQQERRAPITAFGVAAARRCRSCRWCGAGGRRSIVSPSDVRGASRTACARLPDPPIMFGPCSPCTPWPRSGRAGVGPGGAAPSWWPPRSGISFGDESDAADVAVGYFVGITAGWSATRSAASGSGAALARGPPRDEAAQRAVADERVRIARDLHDVVAHHVSVIAVQAEAAQEVLAAAPSGPAAAMADVADTARTALGELRRMLGVLRSDATAGSAARPGGVDELVDSVRRAGLPVTLRDGRRRPGRSMPGRRADRLPGRAGGPDQRAAPRRAPARPTSTSPSPTTTLLVTVSDDGPPVRRPDGRRPTGLGLVGMRERVGGARRRRSTPAPARAAVSRCGPACRSRDRRRTTP